MPPQDMPQQNQQNRMPPQGMPQQNQQNRMPPQGMPQHQQNRMPPQRTHSQQPQPQQQVEYNDPELSQDHIESILEHNVEDFELSENENLELSNALNLAEDGDLNTLLVMELKRPLIIIALSIVFALPAFNRSLLSFIPKLANETGNMNFLGIIVKAILVGLLYYVLDKCF